MHIFLKLYMKYKIKPEGAFMDDDIAYIDHSTISINRLDDQY